MSSSVFHLLYNPASSSAKMWRRIGHTTVVKQKPQPRQCVHHKNTFRSHCPQVQGGRKRFNRCYVLQGAGNFSIRIRHNR